MLGTTLDGYEIEALVGEGSSGRVYRARNSSTGRQVAIKVLRGSAGSTPNHPVEAELLAGLRHPGIVLVERRGVLDNGRGYLIMPWLEGEDLTARQARAPLTLSQALHTIAALCDALQVAHDAAVIHRDIKPANIFLVGSGPTSNVVGQPVLLDFGAATRVELTTFSDQTIIGTPAYMAPEIVRGDIHVGPAADIYSLGATLYELLSGRPPHEGPTFFATLARLVTTPAPRITEVNPRIPSDVAAYVHGLLSLDPDSRPDSCKVVAAALRELASRANRGSLVDAEPHSGRLGSSVQRLITSLVASGFTDTALRDHAIATLHAHEADTVPLGKHSLVAHFGVRRARGSEATSALNLGRRIAKWGARVGVASGRSMVPIYAEFETSPDLGEVVEQATLLSRSAESGEVICDATTVELGQLRYRFRHRHSGQYLVEARSGSGRSPATTPFVGRDSEFQAVLEAFHRCEDHALATVVSVSGSPGIGKTRLQREIVLHLLGECGLKYVVQHRNDPYGQRRPLGAALDALRSLLRLPRDATPSATHNALKTSVTESHGSLTGLDVLSSLLAGSPPNAINHDTDAIRDVLWLVMTEVVIANLEQGTVVMVSEDIQWADPESLSWFEHLLTRAKDRPLLLIVTARHEFWSEHADAFTKHNHLKLQLHPVSDQDVRTIVRASLSDAHASNTVTDEAVERVVGQSGGSPLFAEELARLAARGTNVAIAPTIEAAIQVSLDSLNDAQADAVGRLSVLGATVWHAALSHLGVTNADTLLTSLVDSEILVQQEPSRFAFTQEYQFKHTMIRDVAYARLGRIERRQLHQLAAEWLEACGEDPAIVAGHLDLAELPERAAAYWARAARRALQTNALRDALKMAERAVTFSTDPKETFARAQLLDEVWVRLDARASDRESAIAAMEDNVTDAISHTYAFGARARYDAAKGHGSDVGQRLEQARAQAEQLQLFDEVARCSAELANRAAFAGEHGVAQQEAQRLLCLAESRPHLRASAVDAWQTLAIVGQSRGALLEALDARRNAASAAQAAELRERESVLTSNLGFALTTLGAKVEAKAMLERGIELATSIGSQGALRHGRMLLLCWTSVFGDAPELDSHLEELRAEADEAAAGMWTAPTRETLGILYYRGVELLRRAPGHWSAARGKTSRSQSNFQALRDHFADSDVSPARARILLRISARGYRTTENHDVLPVALGMWALAEHLSKNTERALQIATEAATLLASGAPSLLNESPIFLTLHDVHLNRGNLTDAKAAIQAALPFLRRRAESLQTGPYLDHFLAGLDDNRRLLTLASQYALPHGFASNLREPIAAPQLL